VTNSLLSCSDSLPISTVSVELFCVSMLIQISSIISVSKQRSLLSQLYLALIKTVTGEYGVTLLNILSILLENYTYSNNFFLDLKNTVYALDSTIIDLCLATFKWAYFELKKSAVKIHTQLDLKGNIPSFFLITKAKVHDMNFLNHIKFERDAIYIMDRGYLHFQRLYIIHQH